VPIAFGSSIPAEWGHYPIVAGIKASEWNGFHDFILWDELIRGAPSISSAFIGLVGYLLNLNWNFPDNELGCWSPTPEAICFSSTSSKV
jgi:hypothetical protein